MNAVRNLFAHNVSLGGYRINTGKALMFGGLLTSATYVLSKMWKSDPPSEEERFWERVKRVPTTRQDRGPLYIQGKMIAPSIERFKHEMILSCTRTSQYVTTYLENSPSPGTVLDIGCGPGANAIPLQKKGWSVTAIEQEPAAIAALIANLQGVSQTSSPPIKIIKSDLITTEYPKNADAVVCVDVLPYVPPKHLKTTMEKIFRALRPGGQFVGTLFVKSGTEKDPLIEMLGKVGAHFYPEKEMAREIVTRSGFKIISDQERNDGVEGSQFVCLEFLAEKNL